MLESDKKYFKETLGCSEEQMQALMILFDFPVMSRSSIKDREELSKHIGKDDFYDCWNEYEKKNIWKRERKEVRRMMIIEIPDDTDSKVKWRMNSKEDWKSAEISDLIMAYEARPKGEWIRKVDEVGFISHICSECGAEIEVEDCSDDKFCFNCGAKMQKGNKE